MKIVTHLISGAGNTFHVVNDELINSQELPLDEQKKIVLNVCAENEADGFVFLKKTPQLSWNFFNKDGSPAEMCGNATRCVGFYLSEVLKDPSSQWALQTTAGPIRIEKVSGTQYKVKMTPIQILKSEKGFFCDTGVPHLVIELENMNDYKNKLHIARDLRQHAEFQPKGTNVTFVQLLSSIEKVKAVSYERGVEDFTAACGTGAMAAAAYNLARRQCAETQVEMPGGILKMNLTDLKLPSMIGPAELIGKYEYEFNRSKIK